MADLASASAAAATFGTDNTSMPSRNVPDSRGRGGRPRARRRPRPQSQRQEASSQADQLDTVPSQPSTAADQSSSRGQRRRRGGNRSRGDAGAGTAAGPRLESQGVRTLGAQRASPADMDAQSSQTSVINANSQRTEQPRSRGAARNAAQLTSTMGVGGRQFRGQLTRTDVTDHTSITQLSGEASEFTPGAYGNLIPSQVVPASGRSKPKPAASTAPDISTRIHEDISNRTYECSICTSIVSRRDRIWSCHTCWTVLHLKCVKQWSSQSLSTEPSRSDTEQQRPKTWRCPGCNLPQRDKPGAFTCWCSKEIDPTSLPGLPPFSCGQTCSRSRACPHSCSAMCHAGPCEPCRQMGPTQSCFCGREEKTRKCLETDYVDGWSCGQVCNEIMPCGEHYCGRPCHEGLCGACEVPVEAMCYCGQDKSIILCCDRGEERPSMREGSPDDEGSSAKIWMGTFDCGKVCGRAFDCGEHHCEKACHSQDRDIPHCPRWPDVVSHCPCGKTKISDISPQPRTSCVDEIPLCSSSCDKTLPCGHACSRICHAGDCYPCLAMTEISCRCGKTTTSTMCHQGSLEPPSCLRICRAMLNCARHECGEHCCSGERKAADRIASRKKMSRLVNTPLGPELNFEAEHICTRTCDRPLKCGNHTCPDLCHRGPCSSCREAIFEEISCNCGKTVLQPPLPCGTQPPPCRFDCERSKSCGHPQVAHPCHSDDDSCPKCPFLTTKPCLCGKKKLKNQPCGTDLVRCGELCGKKLKCGWHTCRKGCHRAGECEDAAKACSQACGKEKSCGHPCSLTCHSPFPCKEEKPCEHKIFVTCSCQRIKQETRCGASKHATGNAEKSLVCDDECARLERNRKLQLAFNISAEHQDDHIPYSADTINMYLSSPTWSAVQEKALRIFAADPEQKRLRFQPMKHPQRAFVHSLSQDFGFDSESLDPEPHRHIALFKTPKFVMAPMKSLADCVRIKQSQAVLNSAFAGLKDRPAATQPSSRITTSNEPFNALLLTNAKFGLTIDELRRAIVLAGVADDLEITFLLSEDVVIQPPSSTNYASPAARASYVSNIKPKIQSAVFAGTANQHQHLGNIQECRVDASLNVTRREMDLDSDGESGGAGRGDGWSQVAKAASAPGRKVAAAQPIVSKSQFVVLGSQARKKRSQPPQEQVVDSWEDEVEAEDTRDATSTPDPAPEVAAPTTAAATIVE